MFEVVPAIDTTAWDAACLEAKVDDVHFSSGYARIMAASGRTPMLAVRRFADETTVKPFSLDTIPGGAGFRDVSSLLGYGGVVSSWKPESSDIFKCFAVEFSGWARERRVVCEFCAIHPILCSRESWEGLGVREYGAQPPIRKSVITIDLERPDDRMLASMRPDRRRNILRARRAGVDVSQVPPSSENLAIFLALYAKTMERVGAAARWRLGADHFAGYFRHLPNVAALFFATVAGDVEVASIALASGKIAYSHFTGNARRHPKSGANDLLHFEMARWARSRGCTLLHLGGGLTSLTSDALLAYKAGFSPDQRLTRTSFVIYDRRAYHELCEVARSKLGAIYLNSTFEPAYRREAV